MCYRYTLTEGHRPKKKGPNLSDRYMAYFQTKTLLKTYYFVTNLLLKMEKLQSGNL